MRLIALKRAVVVAHRATEDDGILLPLIDMLPQMVRAGDYDRHQAALRQMTAAASRIETFEARASMRAYFKAGPLSEMEIVREEVTNALMIQAFTDLNE